MDLKKGKCLFLHLAVFLFSVAGAFAQEETEAIYKISGVSYDIRGLTKESAVNRIIKVDTEKKFNSQKELEAYIANITSALENTRQFETVEESHTFLAPEDGITPVALTYTLKDSFHFLLLPFATYNSNSGLNIKLKVKDSNFLGLMEPLNADINYSYDSSENHHIGFNLGYAYPFSTGPLEHSFSNDFSFDWVIGNSEPNLSYSAGLSTAIPLGSQKLIVSFTQSLTKKTEYNQYNDGFYLTEKAGLSLPLSLGTLDGNIPVSYVPSVTFTYNWDPTDNIISYSGLKGPTVSINQRISASRINWKGNFRNGFSFTAGSGAAWNFNSESISANANIEVKLYKAWKYAAITSDIFVYTAYNTTTSITERLRGIRDSHVQRNTSQALVFNIDVPVHIVTTDWVNWGLKLFGPYEERNGFVKVLTWIPHKLFPYLDFELQIAPFIDVALTNNTATGKTFSLKDGFYTAGLEVLVHPARWKSYVVRASFGVDVGRKVLSKFLETSWRNDISAWELYIGIGLGY